MSFNPEQNKLSDIVSQIVGEIDIHQAIDAIDLPENNTLSNLSAQKKTSHVYYVSASPDAYREKKHIHSILKRKDKVVVSEVRPEIIEDKYLTVICLWDFSYKNDSQCCSQLFDLIHMSKEETIRIIVILLNPNIETSDYIPKDLLCLPGFDRVSRELAIFKVVQEEQLL